MARTWFSVTVEQLGGRGEQAVALARWDRSHLSMFTLADVRVVTDEETGTEVAGCDIDDVLQLVGAGVAMALRQRREQAEPVASSVINRLNELLARLRDETLPGKELPVDLDMLSSDMEGDASLSTGGYLDLQTGDVYDENATDPMTVGKTSQST